MKWFKWIFGTLAVIMIALSAGFALYNNGRMFAVRSIPVEIIEESDGGDTFRADDATVADMKKNLRRDLKRFERRQIWEISINDVETLVRGNDWVRSVRVSRLFPDRLEVSITPRAPALLLQTPKGRLVPVAADGRVIHTANPLLLPDVPVLKGERFFTDAALRQQAIDFARELPADGPLSRENIAEIAWTVDDGFVVTLLPSRVQVIFGVDRVAMKVARVEQILNYLSAHQLNGRVIDASFTKKVLVRLRKGP